MQTPEPVGFGHSRFLFAYPPSLVPPSPSLPPLTSNARLHSCLDPLGLIYCLNAVRRLPTTRYVARPASPASPGGFVCPRRRVHARERRAADDTTQHESSVESRRAGSSPSPCPGSTSPPTSRAVGRTPRRGNCSSPHVELAASVLGQAIPGRSLALHSLTSLLPSTFTRSPSAPFVSLLTLFASSRRSRLLHLNVCSPIASTRLRRQPPFPRARPSHPRFARHQLDNNNQSSSSPPSSQGSLPLLLGARLPSLLTPSTMDNVRRFTLARCCHQPRADR